MTGPAAPRVDWSIVPVPVDDGRAAHLPGMRVPSVPLPSTGGGMVDLATPPGRTAVFCYPKTRRPRAHQPAG